MRKRLLVILTALVLAALTVGSASAAVGIITPAEPGVSSTEASM